MIRWAVLGIVVASLLMTGVWVMGLSNSEVRLRVAATNIELDNKNRMDAMKKTLRDTGSVSEKEIEGLSSILVSYARERKGKDNDQLIMEWVHEAVPNVDFKTLQNLQNIIVSARNDFAGYQTRLIDVKREHDLLLNEQPSRLILVSLLGRQTLDITVVTSTAVERSFETGVDDDESPIFSNPLKATH